MCRNTGVEFVGDVKSGKFDLPEADAVTMLFDPNPHATPNTQVLLSWINSLNADVAAAYGRSTDLRNEEIGERLLKRNPAGNTIRV